MYVRCLLQRTTINMMIAVRNTNPTIPPITPPIIRPSLPPPSPSPLIGPPVATRSSWRRQTSPPACAALHCSRSHAHSGAQSRAIMLSVTCLRLSDVSVICRDTYLQFSIQACFSSMSVSQAAQRRTWFTQYRTSDVAEI